MPSQKKLQGESRKAKQANATTKAPTGACNHLHLRKERNWSKSDADAANKLVAEYGSKFDALDPENSTSYHEDLHQLVCVTYNIYEQFNDSRKELFKRLMLANGAEACIRASSQRDPTNESSPNWRAFPFVVMMLEIEGRDKYDGAMNDNIVSEIRRSLDDIIKCPRETVRFFHKRNSCDCLKELYHNLKESTKRTSYCWHCQKVVDIRKLSRCEYCEVAQFCSYECAVAMWPKHKEHCKMFQTKQYKETTP